MLAVRFEMKLRLETTVSLLCLISASEAAFSDSGVPCYLHPSADKCHYRVKPDSPTCTSAEQRQRLTEGIRQLNRTFTILETKLISLGISMYIILLIDILSKQGHNIIIYAVSTVPVPAPQFKRYSANKSI